MADGKKVARILCIDGGGIRGLIPATLLADWEARLETPIARRFHMLAGTSTGGILAAALCAPRTVAARDLVAFYREDGPNIFHRSAWRAVTNPNSALDEKYPSEPLEEALRKRLQGRLSQVEAADLLITAYEIEKRNPYFFKSWVARGLELDEQEKEVAADRDFHLTAVARATAAAPTYFEPASVRSLSDKRFALVDGGVFANNPAMCAYAAARRLYPNADEYLVVSLGTGQLERPIPLDDAKDWGLLGWARPILDVIFDGVSDTVEYQLQQFAPQVRQYRFQVPLGRDQKGANCANDDLDDASPVNLARLEHLAQNILRDQRDKVDAVLETLRSPLTSREALGYPTA